MAVQGKSLRESRWVLFPICFGVIFTDMVGYGIISPSIPLFAKALSASDSQMGYAFAGYPIAFTLFVLPLGRLVDRIGKNYLIISISMFVLSVASLMMAFSTSIGMLIMARALQGLASASAWVATATQPLVAAQPLISRWIDRKGGYVPIYIGSMGLALGMTVVVQAAGFVSFSVIMSFLWCRWRSTADPSGNRSAMPRWGG